MNSVAGFALRVPAQWERQRCIWLAWPHQRSTWPGRFDEVPKFYARWIRLIAEGNEVRVLASEDSIGHCQNAVGDLNRVHVVDIPTNDCWIRDYGPSFVADQSTGAIRGVNWKYNAWGGKYPPWDLDNVAAKRICADQSLPCDDSPLCLEGGAIEMDGRGRAIINPNCIVNENRNPGWGRREVVQELHRRLGLLEVVWVEGPGLAGDDTDGHIDQLARFINRENVVVSVCDDRSDENYETLEENYRQLRLWGDATTPRVEVHRLPIPPARSIDGQRVPESYCNFLMLGQERLLVPTFGAESDDAAIGILKELTIADVIGVDCRDLVWGLGALNCASREQPAEVD